MKNKLLAAAMVVGLSCVGSMGAKAMVIEHITNGGFEMGLTGWSCTGATSCLANASGPPRTGALNLSIFDNDGFATLSQIIATTMGTTYSFSFWSKISQPMEVGNIVRYSLDGGSTTTILNTSIYGLTADSFVASGATASIQLFVETDPNTATWRIDDISVTSRTTVPEPGTLALFGLGLAGLGVARRRKAAA